MRWKSEGAEAALKLRTAPYIGRERSSGDLTPPESGQRPYQLKTAILSASCPSSARALLPPHLSPTQVLLRSTAHRGV